ncbi:MAG TPA: hypothetical protein VHI13_14900 [Candidatus Kapabacteria bacterium]|nr:hypothetical protein [Candidatus Kapabacteria bacterium]
MNTRSLLAIAAAVIATAACASRLQAQTMPYSVDLQEQPTISVEPGGYREFHMMVTNLTSRSLQVIVVRTANDLSNSKWESSICFDDLCFGDTVSHPPTLQLKANETRLVKVNISADSIPETHAHVVIQFSTLGEQNISQKEINVTVQAAGVAAPAAENSHAVYPNPAVAYVSIPLPEAVPAHRVELGIYNDIGEHVADRSDAAAAAISGGAARLTVDLAGFKSGAYFYRLAVDGAARTGSFVVAH